MPHHLQVKGGPDSPESIAQIHCCFVSSGTFGRKTWVVCLASRLNQQLEARNPTYECLGSNPGFSFEAPLPAHLGRQPQWIRNLDSCHPTGDLD